MIERKKDYKQVPSELRFRIDGEEFSFSPLPLGTLAIIERLTDSLNNKKLTIAGLLTAAKEEPDTLSRIVALYLSKGEIDTEQVKKTAAFLKLHCENYELTTLYLCGMMVNFRWMQNAHITPSDLNGISDEEFFEIPFVELKTKKYARNRMGRNTQ